MGNRQYVNDGLYFNAYYKELATFITISHLVAMVIMLFSLHTLVYIEYCNFIGSATILAVSQVSYSMVHQTLTSVKGRQRQTMRNHGSRAVTGYASRNPIATA